MKLLVPCKLLLLGALNIFCGRWELVGRSGESDQDSALEAVFPPLLLPWVYHLDHHW